MNAPIGDSVGALLGLVALAVGLALYIWTALALAAMFRKMGEEGWKGWVPVLNLATVLTWGGFSPWLILLVFFPVLGPIALWVLLVVAAHRINPGFGYGGGMTVVAALFFVVWASILGFGPSRWLGARAAGRPAAAASRTATLGGVFAAEPESREAVAVSVLPWTPIVPEPPRRVTAEATADAPGGGAEEGSGDDDLLRLFAPPAVAAPPSWTPPDTTTAPPSTAGAVPAGEPVSAVPAPPAEPVPVVEATPAAEPAPTAAPVPVAESAPRRAAHPDPAGRGEDEGERDDGDAAWPSEIDDVSAIAPSPFPPSSGAGWRHAMPPVSEDAPIDFVPGRRSTAIPLPSESPAAPAERAPAPPVRAAGPEHEPQVPVQRVSAAETAGRGAEPAAAESEPEPELRRVRPWPAFAVAPSEPDGFPELSGEVSAVIGSPAAGSPRSAAGAVAAQHRRGDDVEDDIDQTVITRRARKPTWQLVPAAGAPVPITADVVILGRRPAGDPAFSRAQLIAVPGEALTVSKTHARLERHEDTWTITDLASTNGVLVRTLMGEEVEVEPGSKIDAGERFFLGDEEFHLQRLEH
mgnify:CR=1 FL=1